MARRKRSGGIGTLFVILGIVGIIGGTFTAGFLAGRHWERVRVVAGLVKPQAGKEPARERAGAARPEPPPLPALTFYQELTAPLASPPPRPAKSDAKSPKAEPATKPDASRVDPPVKPEQVVKLEPSATKPEPPAPKVVPAPPAPKADPAPAKADPPKPVATPEPAPAPADARRSYTVQVAAYATRAQAEALAERLTARGFSADVSETTAPAGVRYRVRVGTYPTKEAAHDLATRLAADVRLSGFVTVR